MRRKTPSSFFGEVLFINLSFKEYHYESCSSYFPYFLGGVGINDWILFNSISPHCKPLSSNNLLIFGAGPLVGTLAPGANRLSIGTKNYDTEGIAYSHTGGKFASAMKFTGIDHIVIRGKADQPIYIWIQDREVEFRDASNLWGKTTIETVCLIEKEINSEAAIAVIGPAGENMVHGASIIVGNRAAARCSVGAIMGSKKLKALAIKGKGTVEVANPNRFMQFVSTAWKKLENSSTTRELQKVGTVGDIPYWNEISALPVRNFQDAAIGSARIAQLQPSVFRRFETGNLSCPSCPIACSKIYKIRDGSYSGTICGGIQSDTIWDFALRLGIDNAAFCIKAHKMCNNLGLDIDTIGPSIAWAFECFEKKILTLKDTKGLKLTWGNSKVVERLIEDIAYRRGLGDLLAKGVKRAAQCLKKGSQKYAYHVKGQNLAEEIRSLIGWALGVIVDSRGGGHLRGAPATEFSPAWSNESAQAIIGVRDACSPQVYKGKPALVVYTERSKAVIDSLGICYFTTQFFTPDFLSLDDLANLLNTAVGSNFTKSDLLFIGERIINVEKAFNTLHAKFLRKDDIPPRIFLEEKIKSGRYKGVKINRTKWGKMLDEYYELHNWDIKTGWQTAKCLKKLGLEKVASKLDKYGLLVN